jgi:hypothetical protein
MTVSVKTPNNISKNHKCPIPNNNLVHVFQGHTIAIGIPQKKYGINKRLALRRITSEG